MEPETEEEIGKILGELGDSEPEITRTDMSGILTAQTVLDPFSVIKDTHKRLLDEPWHVRYCLRMIPIQRTTNSTIGDIQSSIDEIADQISETDTYKIMVEKRDTDISGQELISKIAKNVPNRVSLENPDKIILVEILGGVAGVAVIQKHDILSVEKARRSLSE